MCRDEGGVWGEKPPPRRSRAGSSSFREREKCYFLDLSITSLEGRVGEVGAEASGEGRNGEGCEGQKKSKKGSKKTCFEGEAIDLDWAAPYLLIVNVTRLYIGYSNTQLILTHVRLVYL